MEEEIRDGELCQIRPTVLEYMRFATCGDGDAPLPAGIDLFRGKALHIGDHFGDAAFQLVETGLGVGMTGGRFTTEAGSASLSRVGRALHLPRQVEHVGRQPRFDHRSRVDALRRGMGGCLVQDVGQVLQHADHHGDGGIVD